MLRISDPSLALATGCGPLYPIISPLVETVGKSPSMLLALIQIFKERMWKSHIDSNCGELHGLHELEKP